MVHSEGGAQETPERNGEHVCVTTSWDWGVGVGVLAAVPAQLAAPTSLLFKHLWFIVI